MRPDQSQGNLPVDLAGRMTFGDLEAFRIDLAHQKQPTSTAKSDCLEPYPECPLVPDGELILGKSQKTATKVKLSKEETYYIKTCYKQALFLSVPFQIPGSDGAK